MAIARQFLTRLRGALARFGESRRGGVAIWFGIMMPFIAVGSLGVVDYGAASMHKQTIQDALDGAALIAARSSGTTSSAIDTTGDAAFKALIPANTNLTGFTPDANGRLANVTFSLSGSKVVASATGTYTPIVSHLLLGGPIAVHANSEVVRGLGKLEIAMVLDTTGSMQGTKIANLIDAAKDFVTAMEATAATSTETNPVKISIVPFSTTVKIQSALSMSAYNTSTFTATGLPTYMDGRARSTAWNNDIFTNASSSSARVDRFAKLKLIGRSWGGCVEARAAPYDIRDTAPSSSDVNTLFTPFFWPDEPDTHADYLNDYLNDVSTGTWSAREKYPTKYNTTTFKVSGTFIPSSGYGTGWVYGPNAACDMQTVMRLSTSFSSLRTQIDGLVASGETNIPLGLMWGWHTISPNLPFADGVAYGTANVTKIIVLMTDGDNTMNSVNSNNMNGSLYHGYGYLWQNKLGTTSSSAVGDKMDQRLIAPSGSTAEALCKNIKDKNIYIYTVGVGVSSSNEALLTACATTPGDYYDVNSTASNLNTAFAAIAGSITRLRISQ
jgi:Flp pilus assembly protein TadG